MNDLTAHMTGHLIRLFLNSDGSIEFHLACLNRKESILVKCNLNYNIAFMLTQSRKNRLMCVTANVTKGWKVTRFEFLDKLKTRIF
jgi:hypothetical protein